MPSCTRGSETTVPANSSFHTKELLWCSNTARTYVQLCPTYTTLSESCDQDQHILVRLGCQIPGPLYRGPLVCERGENAYQCSRASSSFPGSQDLVYYTKLKLKTSGYTNAPGIIARNDFWLCYLSKLPHNSRLLLYFWSSNIHKYHPTAHKIGVDKNDECFECIILLQ